MDKKNIAPCGLDCAACNAYIATKTNDEELRKRTAAEWKKSFGFEGGSEAVNCSGCLAKEGVQIGHCAECGIRLCAIGKGHASCASCADYGCQAVAGFWKDCPDAKANLEALRG
jgi:hypothetical protein